MTISYFKRV